MACVRGLRDRVADLEDRVRREVPEVDLEYGEFNDRFATFAKDPRTAYAVLSPRTMQVLLAGPPLDELWTAGPQVCRARLDGSRAAGLDAHLRLLTVCAGDLPSSSWEPPAAAGGAAPG